MSRALAGALIAAAAIVLIVALWLLRSSRQASESARTSAPESATEPEVVAPAAVPEVVLERREVKLWFPAPGGKIAASAVEVESAPEPAARIDALLTALLSTTPPPPEAPLFSSEVKLIATMRDDSATLFVDLGGGEGVEPPASGSQLELQRVYAIVQSVVANEPSVERVVLLWNGVQRPSFAGHVDTGHPLVPRPELDAEPPAPKAEAPAATAPPVPAAEPPAAVPEPPAAAPAPNHADPPPAERAA